MARDAADSANSRSFCGSILWNDACGGGGFGTAMSSVSSSTSISTWEGRISSAEVDSSRPDNNASMSSWLLDGSGAGVGAGGTGVGAGGGAGATTFVAAATAAGIFDGGMSAITAGLAAGATAAGLSGFAGTGAGAAAGLAGFSATGGF